MSNATYDPAGVQRVICKLDTYIHINRLWENESAEKKIMLNCLTALKAQQREMRVLGKIEELALIGECPHAKCPPLPCKECNRAWAEAEVEKEQPK